MSEACASGISGTPEDMASCASSYADRVDLDMTALLPHMAGATSAIAEV